MNDLIEVLTIFRDRLIDLGRDVPKRPTHCEHDVMIFCGDLTNEDFTTQELDEIDALGFRWSEDNGWGDSAFISFRFGSA